MPNANDHEDFGEFMVIHAQRLAALKQVIREHYSGSRYTYKELVDEVADDMRTVFRTLYNEEAVRRGRAPI